MFKFDNNHIFTGYIKQLLSTFNLPTCKIYTSEFAKYLAKHGKEDPRVIESFDTITSNNDTTKNHLATRITYLKSNELYNYFLDTTENLPDGEYKATWQRPSSVFYESDRFKYGLTRTLNSPSNVYDTITHEYLGDYLRFLRDYYNVNLMSLYNCFNNKIYNNLYHKFELNKNTFVTFDSQDPKYYIYAFPVKLFNNYTIAVDCDQGIEMFCGLYGHSLDTSSKAKNLIKRTYKKINKTIFKQPFLFDKLDVKYWNRDIEFSKNSVGDFALLNDETIARCDIANREQDLKLFIKVPRSCKSSIVVLEGDFRFFNDFKYKPIKLEDKNTVSWTYHQNQYIINFDDNDLNESQFTPIGKLQLLAINTGESYPFADRLVEYLSNSAITPIDEIPDNIKRAQKVMNQNRHHFRIEGLWETKMQKIIYDYIVNAGPIEVTTLDDGKAKLIDRRRGYHNRLGHTNKSRLYDILGYVDKDAEKWYASWLKDTNNKAKVRNTIQNIDIYDGLFDI